MFRSEKVNVVMDEGRFPRGHVGIILLAAEQITDSDAMRILPEGVGVHFNRVKMPLEVTVENLLSAGVNLPEAAKWLVPGVHLKAIGYGCTSGSLCIGEEFAKKQLMTRPDTDAATTMITGVIHGLHAVGARRIAVATPYLDAVNEQEAKYLKDWGFEITNMQGMNLVNDFDIAAVAPDFIRAYARSVDTPDAEAIFISCGALRSMEIAEALEEETGKPVITSNQAFLWDLFRTAGIGDRIAGCGRLFRI